jgi:hypothetical protein
MINLVLITSIIKPPNLPLSYISTRSIYSSKERFEQTKKTFETIKEKIPNSKIFLVECSELSEEENNYFTNNSDYFLNLYNNENVKKNIYSTSKSLCEGTMTTCALENILLNNIEFDKLIKISGRYWLSENFNYENFNNNNIVIKYIDGDRDNVFTALYQLPKESTIIFNNFLKNNFDKMFQCIGYEILFGVFIKNEENEKKIIDPIGLCGFVSVSTDFYNG